jgi:two-component system NtrC family response regulator
LDLEALERELITKALHKFEGNQTRAAAYLNLSRKTFLHRLGKINILTREAMSAATVGDAADEST